MAHPYKQFDEHRHGRKVAKNRYQSGGGVPLGGCRRNAEMLMEHNKRIEPIVRTPSQEVDSIISRQKDMDRRSRTGGYAKGGRITGGAESGIGRLQRNKIQARLRKK